MTNDALYTLEELAAATEVAPRTIRYYTSEGLLPPPQSRGRFALYGPAHRSRLSLISRLKQALLPLSTIRAHLPQLTDAQVMALLVQSEPSQDLREDRDELVSFPMETTMVGIPVGEQTEAYQVLLGILSARKTAAPPYSDEVSAEIASPEKPAAEPVKRKLRRALLVSSRLASTEQTENQQASQATIGDQNISLQSANSAHDTWQRILLAVGVELHVRMPDSPNAREHLDQIIAEAKTLFQP